MRKLVMPGWLATTIVAIAAGATLAAASAAADGSASSVVLDGSFFSKVTRPDLTPDWKCPAGTADECGVFQFTGLGPADYFYDYGPTFEPTGKKGCFKVDGTFAITLQSDGSTISSPLAGVFCGPGNSHAQVGTPSYGNPYSANDTVEFAGGTGQFAGLSGTAAFHQSDAGAVGRGTLTGTLAG